MEIAFTVDVEQDVPPFLNTWRGLEEGLPLLLDVLSDYDIPATFFVTGEAAEKYPKLIRAIKNEHEIGCHGYKHERLDRLSAPDQERRIGKATEILKRITGRKIRGFRAPNFKANAHTFTILKKLGYCYDSSTTLYHPHRPKEISELVEIPNTFFSSFLRLPTGVTIPVLRLFSRAMPLLVLDYHPWELVEMKNVRFDCRFATGKTALSRLRGVMAFLRRGNDFKTMYEIAVEKKKNIE